MEVNTNSSAVNQFKSSETDLSEKNSTTAERFKPSEAGKTFGVFGENDKGLRESDFSEKNSTTAERFKPSEAGKTFGVFGENDKGLRESDFSEKNSTTAERFKIDFTASMVTGGGLRTRIEDLRICYNPRCVDYFEDILKRRGSAFCDSASGFLLLDSLLQKNGINRLETAILLDSHGRPYIDDPTLDFSVSHSGGCALCVLAIGEGAAVGCDVQHARDYSEEKMSTLAKTFMNVPELSDFESSHDRSAEFFTAWTRREAYVKRVGSDIFDNLKSAELDGEYFREGVIHACGKRYFYSINTLPPIEDELSDSEVGETV